MFYAHKDQYAKVADTKTILYAKGINWLPEAAIFASTSYFFDKF